MFNKFLNFKKSKYSKKTKPTFSPHFDFQFPRLRFRDHLIVFVVAYQRETLCDVVTVIYDVTVLLDHESSELVDSFVLERVVVKLVAR